VVRSGGMTKEEFSILENFQNECGEKDQDSVYDKVDDSYMLHVYT
jgi:hypothetical protein